MYSYNRNHISETQLNNKSSIHFNGYENVNKRTFRQKKSKILQIHAVFIGQSILVKRLPISVSSVYFVEIVIAKITVIVFRIFPPPTH